MNFVRKLVLAVLVILTVFVCGCTDEIVARSAPASPPAHVLLAPLRIVVFIDQSTSMDCARVAPVMASNFTPVYDRLAISGGELAVGLVRDDSDRPFVRLFVPVPPSVPAARPRPSNVFQAAAARKQEDAERARYARRHRAWRADLAARQAAFARAVEPLLARAADAPATDIWSALRRADVFLSEPNAFPSRTKNVVLLVSDGIETANKTAMPRLNASAQILLVNGAGELGTLAPLAPLRFESLEAALRHVVEEGGSRVRR